MPKMTEFEEILQQAKHEAIQPTFRTNVEYFCN